MVVAENQFSANQPSTMAHEHMLSWDEQYPNRGNTGATGQHSLCGRAEVCILPCPAVVLAHKGLCMACANLHGRTSVKFWRN